MSFFNQNSQTFTTNHLVAHKSLQVGSGGIRTAVGTGNTVYIQGDLRVSGQVTNSSGSIGGGSAPLVTSGLFGIFEEGGDGDGSLSQMAPYDAVKGVRRDGAAHDPLFVGNMVRPNLSCGPENGKIYQRVSFGEGEGIFFIGEGPPPSTPTDIWLGEYDIASGDSTYSLIGSEEEGGSPFALIEYVNITDQKLPIVWHAPSSKWLGAAAYINSGEGPTTTVIISLEPGSPAFTLANLTIDNSETPAVADDPMGLVFTGTKLISVHDDDRQVTVWDPLTGGVDDQAPWVGELLFSGNDHKWLTVRNNWKFLNLTYDSTSTKVYFLMGRYDLRYIGYALAADIIASPSDFDITMLKRACPDKLNGIIQVCHL
jgi:hypothetical protein